MAVAMLSWAGDDGFADMPGLVFTPPDGDHVWVPTSPGQGPLLPHWAKVRPFAMATAEACKPAPPVPFSTEPGSAFYAEALAVYEAVKDRTEEEETIARFWGDDPGRWMAIAAGLVDTLDLSLEETVEMYALLGIGLADGFIAAWDEKYRSYLMRPVTYIRAHIDPDWEPVVSTPPSPAYTSSVSNAAGASARILASLFGEMPFEGPRRFDSFGHAAEEAAMSRVYGGIHYPMGIVHGLEQGNCVGRSVVQGLRTRGP